MKKSVLYFFIFLFAFSWNVDAQKTYKNPILAGDYPDPTIMRDGDDYYMTHSAFLYRPGLVVYHSKDLVNWEPISAALNEFRGSGWASDIKKFGNKYYIYFTYLARPQSTYVVTADSPYGPWSEPVSLKIGAGIDPCVVEADGKKYLFISGGLRYTLTDDGMSVVPDSRVKIYEAWECPSDWIIEAESLEGPKVYHIGEYYYYVCAQGGTAGPASSHMVVVARSKSIDGPFEHMPKNPLIHTYDAADRWWSKGHGSLIDTPEGKGYCVYHGYEKGYHTMGRQTLMDPVHFTKDGWIVSDGGNSEGELPSPFNVKQKPMDKSRLGEFRIGLDWRFFQQYKPERVSVKDRVLTLQAEGKVPEDSAPLLFVASDHNYEFEAEINIHGDVHAGLLLFYNSRYNKGTAFSKKNVYHTHNYGYDDRSVKKAVSGYEHMWLRVRYQDHIIICYYSLDGKKWIKEICSRNLEGYNHNTLNGFLSLLPGIFCAGDGYAEFKNFKYRALD